MSPCNQFREQAKGSDEEINSFCQLRYDTTFPRFKKIDVNGDSESPLYTYLKGCVKKAEGSGNLFMKMAINAASKSNGKTVKDSDIKWNFEKFLVDRNGNVVKRFAPTVVPKKLESAIKDVPNCIARNVAGSGMTADEFVALVKSLDKLIGLL